MEVGGLAKWKECSGTLCEGGRGMDCDRLYFAAVSRLLKFGCMY